MLDIQNSDSFEEHRCIFNLYHAEQFVTSQKSTHFQIYLLYIHIFRNNQLNVVNRPSSE